MGITATAQAFIREQEKCLEEVEKEFADCVNPPEESKPSFVCPELKRKIRLMKQLRRRKAASKNQECNEPPTNVSDAEDVPQNDSPSSSSVTQDSSDHKLEFEEEEMIIDGLSIVTIKPRS